MSIIVSGIPMALIPHPQTPWLEGITPVTNEQWRKGVEPFMNEGAHYGLLTLHERGDPSVQHFESYKNILDTLGRDKAPKNWLGETVWLGKPDHFLFQWRRTTSRKDFDGSGQPAVDISWAEAKAWTLMQGGLYLLKDKQWEWSGQGGEKRLEYATESGKLFGPDGKKLAHCSVGTGEHFTIDVNDPKYMDGPFGLRHKTGNSWEWVERNRDEEEEYGLRGGAYSDEHLEYLAVTRRLNNTPHYFVDEIGFRVGASVDQALK